MTRCPKGTRKNKKTGICEDKLKHSPNSSSTRNGSTRKTQKPVENNNWKIYRISYLYPTITDRVPPPIDQLGFINIQSIILRNGNDNSLAEIEFHGPDKNATTKDLKKILSNDDNTNDISNDISEIKFYGTENDEYGENTTKENIAEVKKSIMVIHLK